jgi:S1-C subfamily serine protease
VVNPGNSGGALVNTNGELIGINTAIQSNTGSYTGYSFAVPVNIVKKVVNDISEFGTVQRAFIGVSIRPIDEELAEEENLKDLNGIYIAGVTDNGGAEDAGLEKGDVIKKVGAVEVKNIPELQEQLSKFRPGDNVMITVMGGNEEVEKSVTLKNRFGNTEVINKKESVYLTDLGVQLDEVNSELKDKLNISGGLQVTTLTPGKLKRAGIEEGFIITKIDDKAIKSKQDFESSIDGKKGGVLIEGIYPNGMKAYYGLGL